LKKSELVSRQKVSALVPAKLRPTVRLVRNEDLEIQTCKYWREEPPSKVKDLEFIEMDESLEEKFRFKIS